MHAFTYSGIFSAAFTSTNTLILFVNRLTGRDTTSEQCKWGKNAKANPVTVRLSYCLSKSDRTYQQKVAQVHNLTSITPVTHTGYLYSASKWP